MAGEVRGVVIPPVLADTAARDGRTGWLETLPATVGEMARRWEISVGAPFRPGGGTAWVAPARTAGGADVVLKLVWPHPEADHEAGALSLWEGRGAARLHRALDLRHTTALLLERCRPGAALATQPEVRQDAVIAGLLRRLRLVPPPGHGLRPLQEMCDQWTARYETRLAGGRPGFDPGLIRAGLEVFRRLPSTADRHVVLCTDLHAGNVLSSRRERWLAVDPKPYIGDPTYDLLQHMLNCSDRLSSDPAGLARRLAGLAGVDPERAILWFFARCVLESLDRPALLDVAARIAP